MLLTELIDESLNHYLKNHLQPVPYHIQVNICHDIALALSYIHSRNIVHRDVSGRCILLLGNARVTKLGDFGMAIANISDHQDLNMCPGTPAYMPPEALTDDPKYTDKVDCFSFGVVVVQVLTKEFPTPSSQALIDDGRGQQANSVNVPEVERQQNHVSRIDPGHPLLPIALDCLKDKNVERPSAHQLCERIGVLKEGEKYIESKRSSLLLGSNTGL